MANATFVKAAQKNIYVNGKHVQYVSEKGKRKGQTLSKIDKTIPKDENDPILIARGESYYWWAFKNGGKHFSKERPKPSQLTQSNYLSQLYTIQEGIEVIEGGDADSLRSTVEDLISELENLKDETQGSLDNMPESLQSSPTGELLQERIDALENAISELEGIDLDYDEPADEDIRQEACDELDISPLDDNEDEDENDPVNEDGFTAEQEESISEKVIELKYEKLQEWISEKIDEIQGVSFE